MENCNGLVYPEQCVAFSRLHTWLSLMSNLSLAVQVLHGGLPTSFSMPYSLNLRTTYPKLEQPERNT
jgi:hypothetical protein